VRNSADDLLNLDFETCAVWALFRPGHLTRQFLEGRRRSYLTPSCACRTRWVRAGRRPPGAAKKLIERTAGVPRYVLGRIDHLSIDFAPAISLPLSA
jgi:hypothetical protein